MTDTTYERADSVYIDTDEGGFQLHVHTDENDYVFDIHASAIEFLQNVKAQIGPYADEAVRARLSMPRMVRATVDDVYDAIDAGYALDDPKSPGYHERMVD